MLSSGKSEDMEVWARVLQTGRPGDAPPGSSVGAGRLAMPLPPLAEAGLFHRRNAQAAPLVGEWQAFDYQAALFYAGGDGDLLAQMAWVFCETVDGLRCRLRDGLAWRDPQIIRIAAYTLKGAAHQFASLRVVTAAQELEEAAANRDWPLMCRSFDVLEIELNRLLPELAGLAATARPGSADTW